MYLANYRVSMCGMDEDKNVVVSKKDFWVIVGIIVGLAVLGLVYGLATGALHW